MVQPTSNIGKFCRYSESSDGFPDKSEGEMCFTAKLNLFYEIVRENFLIFFLEIS